jgi:hypothetical protein
MARRSEEDGGRLLGSAEIASYLVENDGGNEKVIARTSVNSPILAPDGKHVHRLGGVRVKMIEEEDKTVKLDNGGSQFYQKEVNVIQEPLSKKNESVPDREYDTPSGGYSQPMGKDGLTPLQVLKNMVDNHANDIRNFGNWTKIAILLSGIGLAGFIISLGLALK